MIFFKKLAPSLNEALPPEVADATKLNYKIKWIA